MKKVAIIGHGWVGKAMNKLFPEAVVYTDKIGTWNQVNACDIAFICVPTPGIGQGKLDTSIVRECVQKCETSLIVIRSTVNPGDCYAFSHMDTSKHIVYQPEYLGETPDHPMSDMRTRPFLIIGGYDKERRALIDLYTTVYNANVTIRQMTHLEAEIVKVSENRAILWKTLQAQELYDVCEKAGVDYYTIREAVYGDDPRFNLWWTFIMADKPRGCISKCIPKDVYAFCAYAESLGYDPIMTRTLLEKNREWTGV